MKKSLKILVLVLIVAQFACLSAKSKKSSKKSSKNVEAPVWVTDEGRLSMFPYSEYLSVTAYGSSEQEVKNKVAAEITNTISAEVDSVVNSKTSGKSESGSSVEYKKQFSQDVTVSSYNTLYQLEYTTPFYDSARGQYICTGYINRQKAFSIIKPKLDAAAEIFPAEYKKALAQSDNLDKIIGIRNAQKSLVEFYEVYDFATTILTESALKYKDVDILAAEAYASLNNLKSTVKVNIQVSGEYGSEFAEILKNIMNEAGVSVVADKNAPYTVTGSVLLDIKETKNTFQVYPSFCFEVTKSGNVKYSYSKKLGRTSAFDKDTTERRAILAIQKDLEGWSF